MDCVEIIGGKPLCGKIKVQGSKNAVLPVLAACILHEGISRIEACPRIADVFDMIEVLELLGCQVWWEAHSLVVDASQLSGCSLSKEMAAKTRSSILFLGALLGRSHRARIPYPGGCVIGARPVDFHVQAMKALGAVVQEENGVINATAEQLTGTKITLKFPSVGATENIILAAVLAEGTTVLENGAKEPEIEELCCFLNEKGAQINTSPDGMIWIHGVKKLHDSHHLLVSDRIAAGTYLLAAAITKGNVTLERAPWQHMGALLEVLNEMKIPVMIEGNTLHADCRGCKGEATYLTTAPYPGFPTDLQSPMMALLAVTPGQHRIRETVFEARFQVAEQLACLGAKIRVSGNEAWIEGVTQYTGGEVTASELRGAAALFLAGLNTEKVTRIHGCRYIGRGYEDICENLRKLGARIKVLDD